MSAYAKMYAGTRARVPVPYTSPGSRLRAGIGVDGAGNTPPPGVAPADAQQAAAQPTANGQTQRPWMPQTPTALPNEGIYQESQAGANKAYQDAMAALQSQRLGIFHNYGFNPQGSNLDPNAQYGEVQQTYRRQAGELDQAHEAALGRGFGGGHGLAAQIEEAPRYGQGVELNDLFRQYQEALDANTQGQYGASSDLKAALLQARQQQIRDALSQGLFTPADDNTGNDQSQSTGGSNTSPTSDASVLKAHSALSSHQKQLIQHAMQNRNRHAVRPAGKMKVVR